MARKKSKAKKTSSKKAKPKKAVTGKVRRTARKIAANRAKAPTRKAAKKSTARKSAAKASKKAVKKAARRAPARKAKNVAGEGSYTASRNFRKKEEAFVRKNKASIPEMARQAEIALEGPEGADLQAAETEAAEHGVGME
jgi:hypothetical protein